MSRDSRRSVRARAQLAERDPALGLLSLWCVHRDHEGRTETDGDVIRYGPSFDTLPLAEQVGTVAHHVLHVALRHSGRTGAMRLRLGARFDAGLYDAVTDAIVNETLVLAEHAISRPAVTLTGMLNAAGLDGRDAVSALAEWEAERLYAALIRDPDRAAQSRKYAEGQGFKQDVVPSESGEVAPDEEEAWRAHMVRAMAAGEGAGTGVGPVLARVAAAAPSKLPWERQLRRLLAKATLVEPTPRWSRPARRWIARVGQGEVSPFEPSRSLHRPVGRVVVALDTSSSVDADQWHLFGAELRGIQRRSGAECVLLSFDEAVHDERVLAASDDLSGLAVRRGGGTDLYPVFDRAAALDPSVLIVLSDADAVMPDKPGFAVIWALPCAIDPPPPFGDVLVMA